MASMGKPDTNIGELCKEFGISRQMRYRHVSPTGEIRPDGRTFIREEVTTTLPAGWCRRVREARCSHSHSPARRPKVRGLSCRGLRKTTVESQFPHGTRKGAPYGSPGLADAFARIYAVAAAGSGLASGTMGSSSFARRTMNVATIATRTVAIAVLAVHRRDSSPPEKNTSIAEFTSQ
jgi:hypothetical protein